MGTYMLQQLGPNHRQHLTVLAGQQSIDFRDDFWKKLLTFSTSLSRLNPAEVERTINPHAELLILHNPHTQNFQTLLLQLIDVLRRTVSNDADAAERAPNVLYFARVLLKYFAENLNPVELRAAVDLPIGPDEASSSADALPLLHRVVRAVLEVVVSCKTTPASYLLHLECFNMLLAMTSTQLYTPAAVAHPGAHPFTEALMQQHDLAAAVVQALLQHYIRRDPLPPRVGLFSPAAEEERGVLRLVRTAAVSVFWLPMQAYTYLLRSGPASQQAPGSSPLADAGLLVLLVLAHHAPLQEAPGSSLNPFRLALQRIRDADDLGPDAEAGRAVMMGEACISYAALYNALGRGLVDERSVLLLYSLLHDCQHFKEYVLVRSDLDTLLLPLLELLYGAAGHTPSRMYMLLIVLLILSQDASFSSAIHRITLPSVPWYKERLLLRTSLGSLLVLLLLRTAHYNLSKLKDVYLHTNTLAALANLAPHTSGLSSHAAQRLVSLLDMLARRYGKLGAAAAASGANGGLGEDAGGELQVYSDFLRIVLEILNCIVASCLAQNPELVYALLHKQEVLMPLRDHPRFAELIANLQMVVDFFNAKVEAARDRKGWEWSVEAVLAVIKEHSRGWRPERLAPFPELRFTYEEEAQPEDFFVPYVWSLVVAQHNQIPWNLQSIALFVPVTSQLSEGPSRGDSVGTDRTISLDSEAAALLAGQASEAEERV